VYSGHFIVFRNSEKRKRGEGEEGREGGREDGHLNFWDEAMPLGATFLSTLYRLARTHNVMHCDLGGGSAALRGMDRWIMNG